MSNKINQNKPTSTKKMVFMAMMVSYALVLYIIESMIPNPFVAFPGARLGLSNIIMLLCIINFGFKDSFIILTLRIILSTLFAGPFSTILYSMGGGYLSLLGMSISNKIKIPNVGTSIIGAILHNMGQLLVASMIIKNINMMGYMPVLLGAALATGVFVGIVVSFTDPYLKNMRNKMGI